MNHCIVEVAGREPVRFACEPGLSVLDAAAKAGWDLPYSCRRGNCESCRVQVLEGEVEPAASGGTALLCQVRPAGDIRIAADRIEPLQPAARKAVRAKLYRQRMAASDVAVVDLRFPAGVRASFRAGQYLQLKVPGEAPRSFSMANAPKANDGVQLHVRVLPGGLVGERVLPQLQAGDFLELELPYGDFYLREGQGPVVLVAGGTGFAPIQSMLEDALPRQRDRSFTLYWGARRAEGLYALDQVRRWQQKHPHLRFVGVVSDAPADAELRRGFVHEAVLQDLSSLAAHQVYVCGSPAMVAAARQAFVGERGLPPGQFYSDAFALTAGAG